MIDPFVGSVGDEGENLIGRFVFRRLIWAVWLVLCDTKVKNNTVVGRFVFAGELIWLICLGT